MNADPSRVAAHQLLDAVALAYAATKNTTVGEGEARRWSPVVTAAEQLRDAMCRPGTGGWQ